jgi:hypothetical protein
MKMASLYDTVTNNIVAELEKGVAPWVQPWKTNRRTKLGLLPGNAATRRTYSGINIPILWHAAIQAGYAGGRSPCGSVDRNAHGSSAAATATSRSPCGSVDRNGFW